MTPVRAWRPRSTWLHRSKHLIPWLLGLVIGAVGCPSHGASLWGQLFKRKPKVLSSSFHRDVYEENGTLSGGFSKKTASHINIYHC